MSTCSTRLIEQMGNSPTVNYGYDKVRFTGPVFFGDTVSVSYVVAELDRSSGRLRADVKATNQNGDLVAVAVNVLRTVDG
jgi:acyl dehydratase